MECISNQVGDKLISNALWTGVTLKELLGRAIPKSQAKYVVSYSDADEYSESLPLESALNDDVMVVYEMNGQPLTNKHGAPARLLVPGRYGMKSTKWLTRLKLSNKYEAGYWEQRGWDEEAIVKTMSRADLPEPRSSIPRGEILTGGIAFAGARGINEVQVSFDGAFTWQTAKVRKPLSRHTWVIWTLPWEPPDNGLHSIFVRAVDGTGAIQTGEDRETFPDGATGYHSIGFNIE
jgi:DMSO/TMAO reductase YedYZ molybdopterin-dependent catalytic subunit